MLMSDKLGSIMTRHASRILFRADATPELGGGHVMRCLALARVLHERDISVAFACRPGSTSIAPALARSGIPVTEARSAADFDFPAAWNGKADAIFVDLYTSTAGDETRMRAHADIIAVIEDLPDRPHDCDILVDPLPGGSPMAYSGRVPGRCHVMAGGGFALVRPEFAARRSATLERRRADTPVRRILVSMGLTDLGGISDRVTRLVLDAMPDANVEVVLGPGAASREPLESLADREPRLQVLIDIDDMAARMSRADLAIGAGGGTSLERCALGLPSIAVILADNQREATALLHRDGALLAIDGPERIEAELPGLLRRLTPRACTDMALRAASVCDGRGAERVADALLAQIDGQAEGASAHV